MKTLVLGGVKSGKSLYAEQLLSAYPLPWHYIATAQASNDSELKARIAAHQRRRDPQHWQTFEASADISQLARAFTHKQGALLFDCVTLWISQRLFATTEPELQDRESFERAYQQAEQDFLSFLAQIEQPIVLVSNEVGLGGIASTAIMRRFMDAQGQLNQALARHCERVYLVAAGLPLCLKDQTQD